MQTHAQEGPQPIPVTALDAKSWLGRGLYYDVLALAANLLSGIAVALDVYVSGYLRALGGAALSASFETLARVGLELAVFVGSFAWISARLVRAACRDIPRLG
jgi:hypothetical protein